MRRLALAAALVCVSCISEGVPERTLHFGIASASPAASTSVPSTTVPSTGAPSTSPSAPVTLKEFPVPAGSGPHDVAPAADGGVWFTAQRSGQLGWLDPKTGQTKMFALGVGSAPHGVIVDRDGAPWITDGGLNAIVRVEPRTGEVTRYPIPRTGVNLNTAVFDLNGTLWFTGQSGVVGRLRLSGSTYPPSGVPEVISSPRGAGPYGITAIPFGPDVYYASLAGNHIAAVLAGPPVEAGSGPSPFSARPIDPPTPNAGPRRVWSDSKGVIWVSEWNAGQLARYDRLTGEWKEWKLPNGPRPQAYAVFVDDRDVVWLSEWSSSSIVRFDPKTEMFTSYPHAPNGGVRQLHGRPGEVWGALSGLDKLLLVTTR